MNLKEAVYFLECLAKGFSPFDGETINNDSLLNDVRCVRTFYEIRDFLIETQKEDQPKIKKAPFVLKIKEGIADKPMAITSFVERINEVNNDDNMKRITRTPIMKWLFENEYLEMDEQGNKCITQKGKENGIFYDKRFSSSGREYDVITYPVSVMETILNLIETGDIA